MESQQLNLWERFDFDPSCHNTEMDFDIDSIVGNSPIDNFGQSFELEEISRDLTEDAFGLASVEPSLGVMRDLAKVDMDDTEAIFQGLEGLTNDFGVSAATFFSEGIPNAVHSNDTSAIADNVQSLLLPKPDFDVFEIPGCDDLFPGTTFPNVDTIKSDCMWSSTLSSVIGSPGRRPCGRRREFSLTLSECAEGPSSLRDVEGLGTGQNSFLTGMCPLFESSLTSSESDSESVATEEDPNPVPIVQSEKPKIEAGRSLLLSSNRDFQPKPETKTPPAAVQQNYSDHCYFSVQPSSPQSVQGLLTPTESSDDDDSFTLTPGNIDKRKLAHAVQTLMKKHRANTQNDKSGQLENIKFKFRMKFKFTSVNHNGKIIEKRRTILKPAVSPVPAKPKDLRSPKPTPTPKFQQSLLVRNRNSPSPKSGKSTPGSRRVSPKQEQKVREIRDLHNSMERQRRVDLRKNFDRLKSVVPELAEMEKASKLNILNKATIYCSQITHMDTKLKKEADREAAKNQQLKKKLQAFQNFFNNRTRLSSGRGSMVNRASY